VCTSVADSCERLESLLVARAPNLQLARLAVDHDRPGIGVAADLGRRCGRCGRFVGGPVFRESPQQRGLADSGVSGQHHLEKLNSTSGGLPSSTGLGTRPRTCSCII